MDNTQSPSLLRRLAAMLYDTLLILPLIMLTVAAATGLQVLLTGSAGDKDYSATLHPFVVQGLAALTIICFYSCFWILKGQTLGMQAWRIRLRSFNGTDISLRQALLRCICAMISLLVAGAGYWWCMLDSKGRYWHDYLSKSELELLPKGSPNGSPNGAPNGSPNGAPKGSPNGTPNGSPNGAPKRSPNGSD